MSGREEKFLQMEHVLNLMAGSIEKKKSFFIARVGDTENLVLAQEKIYSLEELMNFRYVKMYNRRKDTGFEFPNLEARDLLWAGLQLSTVIGIFPYNDDRIVAPVWMKRPLTERLFSAYNFYPQLVCDVCINREMSSQVEFWRILSNRRVLLISALAEKFAQILKGARLAPFNIHVAGMIPLNHYRDIQRVIEQVAEYTFDCVILTAGVNTSIVGPVIATRYQTTVINFGNSMKFIIEGKTGPGMVPYYYGQAKNKNYIFIK